MVCYISTKPKVYIKYNIVYWYRLYYSNRSYLPAHFTHSIGSHELYFSGIPWETLVDLYLITTE